MNFPPSTLLALGTVLAVLRRRRVSRGSMALAAVVVLGVAGLVTWITLLWPAYWDRGLRRD